MFRLDESERRQSTTIHINGGLVADCARLLEQRCREAMAAGRKVHVVLGRLTAADETGRQLLARLARWGVKLRALDLYAQALLDSIRRPPGGPRQPRTG
ncbi:MAG: hypothetical protein RMI94_04130 [Bryobacterales bacterium]|nr:hypothetical protein [Bryobacteraceae bacterium]MDW8129711.1 hypothetical protein [Bryobacterales bacterium]